MAFVIANAAAGSGKETLVFLSVEAPRRRATRSPCFKKRKLDESSLAAGAAIGGGAKLVEFLSDPA